MSDTVGIAIPSIPPPARRTLARAVNSVAWQTHPVDAISIDIDHRHTGGSAARNRAMLRLDTDWVGFLDDDDELLDHHVEHLLQVAEDHSAEMVWGWFTIPIGADPFPAHFRGRQYDPDEPHCVPITYLVRRDLLVCAVKAMGGFIDDPAETGNWTFQDRPLIDFLHMEMQLRGTRSYASPETTWSWHHHGANTSGLGTRW